MNSPATAPNPTAISTEQIETFWNDGFLVIDDVFSFDEVSEWRELIESPAVLDQNSNSHLESKVLHLLGLTAKHSAFLELARDPRLTSLLQALIGPDVQLQHSKLAAQAKTAGKGGFGWHQDFAFFPHTNTNLVAIMVMLDDATPENGCMSMVRGSHRLGVFDHADSEGVFTGKCQQSEQWELHPEKVVPVTPRVGGISIHHCLTLHGSGPNISGNPRRGMVFQYRADDAYQLADRVFTDTGLMICGQRRGIVRCETGSWVLPWHPAWSGYGSAWNQTGDFAENN